EDTVYVKLKRLLDSQVGGLGTSEDLVHVGTAQPEGVDDIHSIGHESPNCTNSLPMEINGRRSFAATSTMRFRSVKSIGLGNTKRASTCSSAIAENDLSNSSGPRTPKN